MYCVVLQWLRIEPMAFVLAGQARILLLHQTPNSLNLTLIIICKEQSYLKNRRSKLALYDLQVAQMTLFLNVRVELLNRTLWPSLSDPQGLLWSLGSLGSASREAQVGQMPQELLGDTFQYVIGNYLSPGRSAGCSPSWVCIMDINDISWHWCPLLSVAGTSWKTFWKASQSCGEGILSLFHFMDEGSPHLEVK